MFFNHICEVYTSGDPLAALFSVASMRKIRSCRLVELIEGLFEIYYAFGLLLSIFRAVSRLSREVSIFLNFGSFLFNIPIYYEYLIIQLRARADDLLSYYMGLFELWVLDLLFLD